MTKHVAVPIPEVHRYSLAILRLAQVKARTGRSRSSIYADIKAGRFVAPINIGPRAVGWLAHEVDEWITARIAESRGVRDDCSQNETSGPHGAGSGLL